MKKPSINLPIYFAIFLLVILVYIVVIALYESIMKMGTDYGVILNLLIIGLATIFQYPSSLIISEYSNDVFYLLGLIINLSLYSLFIYYMARWILIKNKPNISN